MNIEELTKEQLIKLYDMLEAKYDHSDVTWWARKLMAEVEREFNKRFLPGASKPRVVNKVYTLRQPIAKKALDRVGDYYDADRHSIVHLGVTGAMIENVHLGQYRYCAECETNAW